MERWYLWTRLNLCSPTCYTCSSAAAVLGADNHCVVNVSALLSDSIVSSCLVAPQGDVELEPSGGAKCSAAVRRLGTPGSATGKKYSLNEVPGLMSVYRLMMF